jgi:hypothetical protein
MAIIVLKSIKKGTKSQIITYLLIACLFTATLIAVVFASQALAHKPLSPLETPEPTETPSLTVPSSQVPSYPSVPSTANTAAGLIILLGIICALIVALRKKKKNINFKLQAKG